MEYDQRQEFRVNRAMKKFFLDLGEQTSSEFIRSTIEKVIIERRNPDYIKNLIKQKKDEIKQLEDLLVSPHPMLHQLNNLLEKHAPAYKRNAPNRSLEQKHRFIKDVILPEIKKFGFNHTVEEIDNILLNFPDKNNGEEDSF